MGSLYTRISDAGYAEHIDVDNGKLVKLTRVDDPDDVPTYTMQCSQGRVEVSAMIPEESVDYLKHLDLKRYLSNRPVVKQEICSLVAEGRSIDEISKMRRGEYLMPPSHIITMWAEEDSDFAEQMNKSRRLAARSKFDQALRLALDAKDDPKALKTLVDILKRHAEVDDPEVFQVKAKEEERQPAKIHISFNTGVPDAIDVTPKEKQLESRSREEGS